MPSGNKANSVRKNTMKSLKRVEKERCAALGIEFGGLTEEMRANPEAAWEAAKAGPKTPIVHEDTKSLHQLSSEEYTFAIRFCHALYTTLKENRNTMQLGDLRLSPRVAMFMSTEMFKRQKFVNIIYRHPDLFTVDTHNQEQAGQWTVAIIPGSEASIPHKADYDAMLYEMSSLPPRKENVTSGAEGLQALRIEIVWSLKARGGSADLQHVGQEPRVSNLKAALDGKSLREFCLAFPSNFALMDQGNGNWMAVLQEEQCPEDSSAMHRFEQQQSREQRKAQGYKGGGKSGGKGRKGDNPDMNEMSRMLEMGQQMGNMMRMMNDSGSKNDDMSWMQPMMMMSMMNMMNK